MDSRVNQNRIQNTQFSASRLNKGEVKNVEKLVKEIIADAVERAEREVADYGSFTFSLKKFKNPDTSLVVEDFWIGIEQPPKGIENYQKNRGVKFFASKKDTGEIVEILLEYGTKDEILKKIKGEEFYDKLMRQTKNLSYHLQDL